MRCTAFHNYYPNLIPITLLKRAASSVTTNTRLRLWASYALRSTRIQTYAT